jgi:hypothetical protein
MALAVKQTASRTVATRGRVARAGMDARLVHWRIELQDMPNPPIGCPAGMVARPVARKFTVVAK